MAAVLRYRRQRNRRETRVFRDRTNPMDCFNDRELYEKFRFCREDIYIYHHCDELDPALQRESNRGGALPVVLQVCLALRFFATGTFQDAVGEMIGVSQPTVSRTVQKVMDGLIRLMPQYIRPPSPQEAERSKIGFHGMANLPGIIGCIDGTHVRIQAPRDDEDVYVNRKNYHSVNVLILCDHRLLILDCVATSPGSFHDARISRESALFRGMETQPPKVNGLILGDSGYPIRKWLMTPYGNPVGNQQNNFNEAHRATRVTVERCTGVLKRRWHSLHTELRMQPDRCSKVIHCCAILHNKATLLKLPVPDPVNAPSQPPDTTLQQPQGGTDRAATAAGQAVREEIARNHF